MLSCENEPSCTSWVDFYCHISECRKIYKEESDIMENDGKKEVSGLGLPTKTAIKTLIINDFGTLKPDRTLPVTRGVLDEGRDCSNSVR